MNPKIHLLVILSAAIFSTGCASTSGYNRPAGPSSLEAGAYGVHAGRRQIDAAMFALTGLVNNHTGADIANQFRRLDSAVDSLEQFSDDLDTRVASMRTPGDDYLGGWGRDLAKIRDEDIRSSGNARDQVAAARFGKVQAAHFRIQSALIPFMSALEGMRGTLAVDPTTRGIAAIQRHADKVNTSVTPLRDAITALEAEFKALGVGLSAAVPAE